MRKGEGGRREREGEGGMEREEGGRGREREGGRGGVNSETSKYKWQPHSWQCNSLVGAHSPLEQCFRTCSNLTDP